MFELQKSIIHDGVEYPIRTDYRDVLNIIMAFEDQKLSDEDKIYVLWTVLFESESPQLCQEVFDKCVQFLNAGLTNDINESSPKLYSWNTDGAYIINAINKSLHKSIRELEYLHWFDFIGFFSEIGESTFSMIVSIRQKRLKGTKLEKYEQDFYNNNRSAIDSLNESTKLSLDDLKKLADLYQNKER